jgi:hypothetical protein
LWLGRRICASTLPHALSMRVIDRHPNAVRLALVLATTAATAIALFAIGFTGPFAGTTSATSTKAAGWSGYGVGNWPGANWRPYAKSSPFNKRISSKVHVHKRSRQYVSQLLKWSLPAPIVGGVAGTSSDYAHPTYWAQRSDPVYKLKPSSGSGDPSIRGDQIRIPAGAKPAMGADGHMAVIQPDGWEYDFWQAQAPGGGVLNYAAGSRIRINGSGIKAGATASDFGNLAGVIRAPELSAGKINHALFLVVRCTASDTSFGFGARRPNSGSGSAFVYPASGGGSACGSTTDAPPMGARIQLAMRDKKIRALHLPKWKRAILRALARYGAYIGDTGGPGIGIQIESSLTYMSFGRADPLVQLGRSRQAAGDHAVKTSDGRWLFDVSDGVNWLSKLRVVAPPKH